MISRRGWLLWGRALGIWLFAASVSPAQSSTVTEEDLQKHGLTKAASGAFWITGRERRLRESITKLQRLRTQVVVGNKELADLVAQNAERWKSDRPLFEQLRSRLAQLNTDDPERATVTQQLQRLRLNSAPPADLIMLPRARRLTLDLVRRRDRLATAVENLRRQTATLVSEYEGLAKEERVRALLLQTSGKLGPVADYARGLASLEKPVRTDYVPMFEQSGQLRFTGIVNGRAPLTFTWASSHDSVLVPRRLVEATGIDLAGATLDRRTVAKGRQVNVWRTKLKSLRFGAVVLKDVVVEVLPPEAEDVGARIGYKAFADTAFGATPKPELLKMVFVRRGEAD